MSITPRGMSVTEAYRNFREDKFIVNRKYQRKLVWTEEEKQHLIDSIVRQYPIPLILLAQRSEGLYEIIDGMQRLNAIFAFIENEFPMIDGKYFAIEESARAKIAHEEKMFESAPLGSPKMSATECANLLDYQLAVTIYPGDAEDSITDVFGRINSGGKQLSPQEQRQAGVTSAFASVIRILSAELRGALIRGDCSVEQYAFNIN